MRIRVCVSQSVTVRTDTIDEKKKSQSRSSVKAREAAAPWRNLL